MKHFRIIDRTPPVLDIEITTDDIMRDLDPNWLVRDEPAQS